MLCIACGSGNAFFLSLKYDFWIIWVFTKYLFHNASKWPQMHTKWLNTILFGPGQILVTLNHDLEPSSLWRPLSPPDPLAPPWPLVCHFGSCLSHWGPVTGHQSSKWTNKQQLFYQPRPSFRKSKHWPDLNPIKLLLWLESSLNNHIRLKVMHLFHGAKHELSLCNISLPDPWYSLMNKLNFLELFSLDWYTHWSPVKLTSV